MTPKNENQINAEQVSMQIIMRLRQIIQEMSKHSKLLLENYKISTPQLICLNEVFQHGPISIGALTKIVFLNNSTVTGIIDRLEQRELVRRVRETTLNAQANQLIPFEMIVEEFERTGCQPPCVTAIFAFSRYSSLQNLRP